LFIEPTTIRKGYEININEMLAKLHRHSLSVRYSAENHAPISVTRKLDYALNHVLFALFVTAQHLILGAIYSEQQFIIRRTPDASPLSQRHLNSKVWPNKRFTQGLSDTSLRIPNLFANKSDFDFDKFFGESLCKEPLLFLVFLLSLAIFESPPYSLQPVVATDHYNSGCSFLFHVWRFRACLTAQRSAASGACRLFRFRITVARGLAAATFC